MRRRASSTRSSSTSTSPRRCARSPARPTSPSSEGRSLLGYVDGADPAPRTVSVSENWGFAAFETERYKLVVDEDACAPCQLFDLARRSRTRTRPACRPGRKPIVDELMETHVRPFFATPPARPHKSIFTG